MATAQDVATSIGIPLRRVLGIDMVYYGGAYVPINQEVISTFENNREELFNLLGEMAFEQQERRVRPGRVRVVRLDQLVPIDAEVPQTGLQNDC